MKPGLFNKTPARARILRYRCNLCHAAFRAPSRFARFRRSCKSNDELFRFSEWLRDAG